MCPFQDAQSFTSRLFQVQEGFQIVSCFLLSVNWKTFPSVKILFEYNLSDVGTTMAETTENATTDIATTMQNMTAAYEPEGKFFLVHFLCF